MRYLIIALLLCTALVPASAQNTKDTASVKDTVVIKGTISGKVTTEEGLPIPEAEVYVYNIDDIIASATTDSAGNYLTNRMVIGTYRVWVKSKGYVRKSIDNITVKAWADTKLDITLSVFRSGAGTAEPLKPDAVKVSAVPYDSR